MKKLIALAALLALAPSLCSAWWNKDWTERRSIAFNTTEHGVAIQEAQTQVPVAIRLHSGNFDFSAAKEDGSDLRFVAGDDKTLLGHHVERYDALNELAVVWVLLPRLAAGSDKERVYLYFGNAAATAQAGGGASIDAAVRADWHFSGNAPLQDVSASGLVAQGTFVPQKAALLGDAAVFSGAPLSAEGPALALPAGAALTLSMWVKPSAAAGSLIAQGGVLNLSLSADGFSFAAAQTAVKGGTVKPGSWQHVAVSAGAGSITLYVDGVAVGSAQGQLPELAGQIRLGDGYAGELDEVQIAHTARGAEWIRLAAAGQAADSRLLDVRADDDEGAGESGGDSYFGILVGNLTVDAWVVIAILGVMFAISAAVMVGKAHFVGRADRDNRAFLGRFRGASQEFLTLDHGASHPHSSLFRLYQAGVREIRKRFGTNGEPAALSGASIDAIKAAIDADLVRETHRLNAQMVLLTIAISGGPFLGLLGTVVGVMITFAAIAAAGDVNVNAIAPGIAAALLATVAGLGVAIPALFGYNYLASRIKNITADMQIFVDEFVTRVAEVHGK